MGNHNHHSHNHGGNEGIHLIVTVALNFFITLIEVAGGIMSNSFALLSDALHNFGDTLSIFLAYLSNKVSHKIPTAEKTFGFKRVEIMAALVNSIIMVAVCIYLFLEAFERLNQPKPINGLIMMFVAAIGLLGNFMGMSLLKDHKEHNLNIKAAYIHLLGDTLSSVAVLVGGIFIYIFKVYWLDPLLTFIIGIYILKETWNVLKEAYLILLQATPPELDLAKVKAVLEIVPEIENIHHVHAWKLNDAQIHFECHIDLKQDYHVSETEAILFKIKKMLEDEFSISHTTVQFEYNCCNNKAMIY